MPLPAPTVRVVRTGPPCFVFDPVLDRGFHFVPNEVHELSEFKARELLRNPEDGWAEPAPSTFLSHEVP